MAPRRTIASVGLMEVADELARPQAYAARFGGLLPYDYVWFTPRADDEDPCRKFEKQLRRLRGGEKSKA